MKHRVRTFHTAVIGAGASGTLLSVQFLRHAPSDTRLALVEAGPRVACGVAYGTLCQSHLLNVRASNMSAFPDQMDHFVRWLEPRLPNVGTNTFAPRMLYGDYLAEVLNEQAKGRSSIVRIASAAVKLTRRKGLWTVHLQDGSFFFARTVVLALGNLPPNDPTSIKENLTPAYVRDPWSPEVARGLSPDAQVFLIGTGLTMVDVVLALRANGHRGQVHALSRHGYLPQAHKPQTSRCLFLEPQRLASPGKAMRWLRKEIQIAHAEGYGWRSVIDGMRPYLSVIWRSWNSTRRASFLRHARTLWDVHRHRMAPEVATTIETMIAKGELSIHRGKIIAMDSFARGAMVSWRPAGTDALFRFEVARVINCTGPTRDYAKVNLPLIAQLCGEGWLTPDSLKLGMETDDDGRLIGADGQAIPGLFTIGPSRLPRLWESVAIPEIREQAVSLAKLLVAEALGSLVLAPDVRMTA